MILISIQPTLTFEKAVTGDFLTPWFELISLAYLPPLSALELSAGITAVLNSRLVTDRHQVRAQVQCHARS